MLYHLPRCPGHNLSLPRRIPFSEKKYGKHLRLEQLPVYEIRLRLDKVGAVVVLSSLDRAHYDADVLRELAQSDATA